MSSHVNQHNHDINLRISVVLLAPPNANIQKLSKCILNTHQVRTDKRQITQQTSTISYTVGCLQLGICKKSNDWKPPPFLPSLWPVPILPLNNGSPPNMNSGTNSCSGNSYSPVWQQQLTAEGPKHPFRLLNLSNKNRAFTLEKL